MRVRDEKRESEGRYRAVLREYHSQWRLETRTSPSHPHFFNGFYSGVSEPIAILQSCASIFLTHSLALCITQVGGVGVKR